MAASNRFKLLKRVSGVAGAPSALLTGELAWNMVDGVIYGGFGDDTAGNATSIVPVAGNGAFVQLSGAQTIAGKKTFSAVPASGQDAAAANDLVRKSQMDAAIAAGGNGDMLVATYDTNANGTVDAAETVPWTGVSGKPTAFTAAAHTHATTEITGLDTALAEKAPLNSPAFTGNPTANTQITSDNTTKLATTAFVQAVLSSLIDAAPGALDTLNELAAAIGDDPNFAATVTNGLALKVDKAANLSDLPDPVAARAALGLGSMALQSAASVAITGGVIDGVTIDGGTF